MAAGPSLDDRDPRRSAGKRGDAEAARRARSAAARSRGGRPTWKRALRIGAAVATLGLFAAIAGVVGLFSYYGSDPKLPNLSRLDTYRPKQVTRILDRNGAPIGELGSEKRTVVPYDAIPKLLINAVVAAEDADYFQHGGLDYRGMVRAFIENVLRGRTGAGRLDDHAAGGEEPGAVAGADDAAQGAGDHPGAAAVGEAVARKRSSRSTSTRSTTATAATAARRRRATSSASRCATSTWPRRRCWPALPQSPERLSPRKHPDAAKTRQRYVLGQMADARLHRPQATADRLAAEPIRLAREPAAARGIAAEAVDVVGARAGRASWASRRRSRAA